MKKFLFPFKINYPDIAKYWWHRLFVVLFFSLIIFSGIYIHISLQSTDGDNYSSCLSVQMNIHDESQLIDKDTRYEKGKDSCSVWMNGYSTINNFMTGIVVSVLLFFLLQAVYYKIFLYIIFGKKNT